ncbi:MULTISPECIES: helix-turn-helix domain-containing protein [unclassified Azospirillum]|jgi:hypothetical protein|uniref:helix-turn-helix domain-containing protein n=1 Tax=unclassified Azospirillum TaxID=2630922 RepID=UPI000303835E|nr:hypothetical protein [Azospirillum sp. B510]
MFALRGEQIRAGRALKRWSRKQLAQEASRFHPVSEETIRDWEGIDGVINATTARANAVVRAFDEAGVELLNHGAPGARLRAVEQS